MRSSDVRRLTYLAAVLVCALHSAGAQDDAGRLQQSGIRRIDAFIEHFRKTGEYRSQMQELRFAEAELAESAAGFAAAGQLAPAAWSLIKLGDARRMQDRAQEAREAYDRALGVARQAEHAGYQAKALIGLAKIESTALRDYGAAAQHVDDALRLAAPLEDSTFYLDALEQRSAIDVTRRDLVAAADAINRVLAMAEARQDRVRLLFGHFSRADVYQQMVRSCTEARQSFSLCYEALGLAKADYARAQSLSTDLGFEGLANEMAGFLRRLEQYRALVEQQESFTKSVERFALFEPGTPSDVLVTEQFATGSQSIPPGLTELISQAGITSSDPVGVYTQAMFAEAQGNADAALRDYLKAVDLLERDRRTLKDESSRGSFLEDKVAIYDPPILHLLDRRQYAEAFALLERSRARAMTDLFTTRALGLSRAGDQRLYAAAVKSRSEIALLQKKLFDLTRAADRDRHADDIRALESQINERQQQYDEALGRIRQEAPKLLDLMVSDPVPLARLQRAAAAEGFDVLIYQVLESGVNVWHIGAHDVTVRNVFLPRSELTRKVTSLRRTLERADEAFDARRARELFLFLVQPVLGSIATKHLVVVPDEDLHLVPFQVLLDPNGASLGERYEISYAPSATVLMDLRKLPSLAEGRLLAAADPDLSESARQEVTTIASLYEGRNTVVIDRLVTESELKSTAGNHQLIHLAVHGEFVAREPLLSRLVLARNASDDGSLTAAEMFGLPLEKVGFVALSACETGQAQTGRTNEVLGMVRALLYAGAQSLVLSSWKVDSPATSAWMQAFYREARQKPVTEAARLAIAAVKNDPRYAHPYYWGAFMVIGK